MVSLDISCGLGDDLLRRCSTRGWRTTPGWGWESRKSHVAVTHWKLFFKTFSETVCLIVCGKPCKKFNLCYSFLERRVEGPNTVGMLVNEACETAGYVTRMGCFAVCAEVRRAKPLQSTISASTGRELAAFKNCSCPFSV